MKKKQMPSDYKSKKKTGITLMEIEIEKGINEKKVQNLVLKKILEEVKPDGKDKPEYLEIKDQSSKH